MVDSVTLAFGQPQEVLMDDGKVARVKCISFTRMGDFLGEIIVFKDDVATLLRGTIGPDVGRLFPSADGEGGASLEEQAQSIEAAISTGGEDMVTMISERWTHVVRALKLVTVLPEGKDWDDLSYDEGLKLIKAMIVSNFPTFARVWFGLRLELTALLVQSMGQMHVAGATGLTPSSN